MACAVGVLGVAGTGCYSYQRSALPQPGAADQSLGPYARITTRSGSTYSLASANVVGDSVIGFAESNNARVAIAVSDVDTVARWGEDGGKSVGLLAGIAGALLLVAVGVFVVLVSIVSY